MPPMRFYDLNHADAATAVQDRRDCAERTKLALLAQQQDTAHRSGCSDTSSLTPDPRSNQKAQAAFRTLSHADTAHTSASRVTRRPDGQERAREGARAAAGRVTIRCDRARVVQVAAARGEAVASREGQAGADMLSRICRSTRHPSPGLHGRCTCGLTDA